MPRVTSSFHVDASAEAVRQLLRKHVRPAKIFTWAWSGPPLMGRETDDGFLVWQVIEGRNSFNPRIEIDLVPEGDGTMVRADFRLNAFVLPFVVVWLAFALQFLAAGAWLLISRGVVGAFVGGLILVVGGGVFSWWGIYRGFPAGAAKGEKLLGKILGVSPGTEGAGRVESSTAVGDAKRTVNARLEGVPLPARGWIQGEGNRSRGAPGPTIPRGRRQGCWNE